MKNEQIIHGKKLPEVLREQLKYALSLESIKASEETEFYLVNLLNEYHMAGNVLGLDNEHKPLGIMFMEAMSKAPSIKAVELKRIGDGTLITLGFFADSVRRSIVDRSYYLSIGASAYDELADVVVCDSEFAEIYAELASNFLSLIEALARIAPWNRASSNTELMQIYSRWLESGDEKLEHLLRKEGILPKKE
ncbi:MAG: hypothetical protein ABH871_04665 [Pseudomonadota bacterium]